MSHPKLKICGINDPRIAAAAEAGGADYLGFIFVPGSPRAVTPERAKGLFGALEGKARRVGVFVKDGVADIERIAGELKLDVVQLHAAYSDADVLWLKEGGFEVWRLDDGAREGVGPEDAVLLDGRAGEQTGGTGRRADWERARALKAAGKRVVLAGGLSAENLAEAVGTGCDVLDVNSSLEVERGVKSREKVERLLTVWREILKQKTVQNSSG